ncbi:hypothetical protein [Thioalkalivibrio denitrificans]|nr:hypothetical protein [Thioalkalivibrio denitrificans]
MAGDERRRLYVQTSVPVHVVEGLAHEEPSARAGFAALVLEALLKACDEL